MALTRRHYENRESWLAGRGAGIGASEAAAACGRSPWQTPIGLWRLKTGRAAAADMSGNEAVQNGIRMEPVIRELYSALHPEYALAYFPYDILAQSERPWLTATLDGELTHTETGQQGILEIKTTASRQWAEWGDGSIPAHYFLQGLHQLLATGWDFVNFACWMERPTGDAEIIFREIWREDVQADMKWLLEREERFWGYIQSETMPPMQITF